MRAVDAVTGPVGLPLTYSTWIFFGSAAPPAPYRGPCSSTLSTTWRYHAGVARRLTNPGPATSAEAMNGESMRSAICSAIWRGAARSGLASWSAAAVA